MPDPKSMYGIQVTVGTATKYLAFSAPKALYDGIATACGLEKIDTPAEQSKAIIVPASRFLNRVGIVYDKTADKKQVGSIWVAPDKLEDVLADPPQQYRSYTVTKAFQPLDSGRR